MKEEMYFKWNGLFFCIFSLRLLWGTYVASNFDHLHLKKYFDFFQEVLNECKWAKRNNSLVSYGKEMFI